LTDLGKVTNLREFKRLKFACMGLASASTSLSLQDEATWRLVNGIDDDGTEEDEELQMQSYRTNGNNTNGEMEASEQPAPKPANGNVALKLRAWDLRLRKCAGALGDWQNILDWGKKENDPRIITDALSKRTDLLTAPILEEARKKLPLGFPYPNANLDLAFLDICCSLKENNRSAAELDELVKRCVRTALLVQPRPSKGVSQRLAELEESIQFYTRASRMSVDGRFQQLNTLLTVWTNRPATASVTLEEWASIANWRLEFLRICNGLGANAELEDGAILVLIQSARHARSKYAFELAQYYINQALRLKRFPKAIIGNELTNERVRIAISATSQPSNHTLQACYRELEATKVQTDKKDTLSELHRLRARVLHLAGKGQEVVEEAYTLALQADPANARTWLDWARYLTKHSKAEAATCIGNSIALGLAAGRLLIPLLLEPEGTALAQIDAITPATFIPWIFTLLQSASTSPFAKATLERLAQSEPQAMLHELKGMNPNDTGPNSSIYSALKETIRKSHFEIFQEFSLLQSILEQANTAGQAPGGDGEEFFLSMKQDHSWRPRSLRIPGTRRKLDRIHFAGKVCGRKELIHRVDFSSDDGRAPVRFALHCKLNLSEAKKSSLVLVWLLFEIITQEGSLAECFTPPAIFPLAPDMFLEKDINCTSLNQLVLANSNGGRQADTLKKWFFHQFSDLEAFLTARKRFTRQLSAHSLSTAISDRKSSFLTGAPHEILVGRGVDSSFVMMGIEPSDITVGPTDVPFRLSPQLEQLITTQGVWGSFASGLSSCARCLAKHESRHALIAYLGEDYVDRIDVLNEDSDERDQTVLRLIQQSLDGIHSYQAKGGKDDEWMSWC
jgi:hypothetical protein